VASIVMAEMRLSEFIEKSNAAATADEVCALFRSAVEGYGFNRMALAAASSAAQAAFPARAAGPALAFNCPEDWVKHYLAKQYQEMDPVLLNAPFQRRPYRWKDLKDQSTLSTKQRQILQESEDAKVCNGLSIPLHGPAGESYVISLATEDHHFDSAPLEGQIHVLAIQFYVAYASLTSGPGPDAAVPRLSHRERECLSWSAQGKSAWAIGMILGVSENTVNFHIKSAMRKLGTTNRVQAVALAVRAGLIHP
jgi:LuxR family quorum-sensing system transcriptional regulator CciR